MFEQIAILLIENIQFQLRQNWQSRGYGGSPTKNGIGPKIASSNLYNNIDYRIEYDENGFPESFNIIMEDYWYWIDRGRRPGSFPPVTAIRNWIIEKGINFPPVNGRVPTLEQKTYMIGRSIAEKGTDGTNFVTLATDQTFDEAIDMFGEAFADQIQDFLDLRIVLGEGQDELAL